MVTENRRTSNSEYRTPKFRTSIFCGSLFVNLRFSGNNPAGNAHENQALTLTGESAGDKDRLAELAIDTFSLNR